MKNQALSAITATALVIGAGAVPSSAAPSGWARTAGTCSEIPSAAIAQKARSLTGSESMAEVAAIMGGGSWEGRFEGGGNFYYAQWHEGDQWVEVYFAESQLHLVQIGSGSGWDCEWEKRF